MNCSSSKFGQLKTKLVLWATVTWAVGLECPGFWASWEASRLLVIQGDHLTTRESHWKAADRIKCWGQVRGDGDMLRSPHSIRGCSSFGGKTMYFESGIETQSQELGQDLSHPLGAGTSLTYQVSACRNLGARGYEQGSEKRAQFRCPGPDLVFRWSGISISREPSVSPDSEPSFSCSWAATLRKSLNL